MKYGFPSLAKASMVAMAVLTGASGISFAAPYGAFATSPTPVTSQPIGTSAQLPVQNVDWRGHSGRDWRNRGGWGRSGRGWDRGGRNWDRNWRRGGWRDGDRWRGDRWRHGRSRYNNFGTGAAIGLGLGLLAAPTYEYYSAPRRVYRQVGNSHVQWCYNRYRSYRASDNTFQPYNGGRQQCYSPYS